MKLISYAKTAQEFKLDLIKLLDHHASQIRDRIKITSSARDRNSLNIQLDTYNKLASTIYQIEFGE